MKSRLRWAVLGSAVVIFCDVDPDSTLVNIASCHQGKKEQVPTGLLSEYYQCLEEFCCKRKQPWQYDIGKAGSELKELAGISFDLSFMRCLYESGW